MGLFQQAQGSIFILFDFILLLFLIFLRNGLMRWSFGSVAVRFRVRYLLSK